MKNENCATCGGILIGKTAERMEKLLQKGKKPTRWMKIPIWSFSKAA